MLTVQLTVDGGKFRHPARNISLQGLHFAFGQARARPGLFQSLLEFPSLVDSELLFLGGALFELGVAALQLFEFGFQPRLGHPGFSSSGTCGCCSPRPPWTGGSSLS